jgi:hydroxyacylglutathione hydrolase
VRPAREREAAVIDMGANLDQVRAALASVDGDPSRLILTHGHYDHVTHARAISEALGLPIEVHASDRRLVFQAAAWSARFGGHPIPTPRRVELLAGAEVALGRARLRVRHTPGHTPGSVVLVAEGLLFTGDTLLRAKVGRTDLPVGDSQALRETIEALVADYPPEWRILPGHGDPWTVGEARSWWSAVRDSPPALERYDV